MNRKFSHIETAVVCVEKNSLRTLIQPAFLQGELRNKKYTMHLSIKQKDYRLLLSLYLMSVYYSFGGV